MDSKDKKICTHPMSAIRAQRPGAGEGIQPNWCIMCGQELNDDGTPYLPPSLPTNGLAK